MEKKRLDPGQIEVVDDVIAGILREKTPAERILEIRRVDLKFKGFGFRWGPLVGLP